MCLQPSPTYVTLPPNVRPIYGRLAWLDELRLLAILVMVLDHTLLFFGQEIPGANVVRLTLTRCAEPLFVVVLTFLTIYLGRPMKASRWLQIALVSVATSAILSHHLGYAALGASGARCAIYILYILCIVLWGHCLRKSKAKAGVVTMCAST